MMRSVTRSDETAFAREAAMRVARMREDFRSLKGLPDLERRALLNSVFRDMHSLKGAAQAQGLRSIATVAHRVEDLLSVLRSGDALPTDRETAVFLTALDLIGKAAANLHMANFVDVSPLLALIDGVLDGRTG